jgi:hypothetical protein
MSRKFSHYRPNLPAKAKGVVHFYNKRGTMEQWIKEGKYALKPGSPAIGL